MKQILTLFLIPILLFSCTDDGSKENTSINQSRKKETKIVDTTIVLTELPALSRNELTLIKPKNITLDYELLKLDKETVWSPLKIKQTFKLKCTLTNHNKFPVYLVSYSCSDVPGVLKIDPVEFENWQTVNCNMSWALVEKIAPNQSREFSTNIGSKGNSEIKNLGVYLKFVNRMEDFEILKKEPDLIKNVIYTAYDKCAFVQGRTI